MAKMASLVCLRADGLVEREIKIADLKEGEGGQRNGGRCALRTYLDTGLRADVTFPVGLRLGEVLVFFL